MELETAARRHLLRIPSVTGYVGRRVFKNTLVESPAGTAGYAIVVRRAVGWTTPDTVKTLEYPRLIVECWADPDREPTGETAVENAIDKAYALYRAVDRVLHGRRDEWWGAGGTDPGLRVISCVRAGDPVAANVMGPDPAAPGGGGADGRSALFGEMAMVPAGYDIVTAH